MIEIEENLANKRVEISTEDNGVFPIEEGEWEISITGGQTEEESNTITLRVRTPTDYTHVLSIVERNKWTHVRLPFSPFLRAPMLSAQKEEESVSFIISLMSQCAKVCWIVPDEEKQLWMFDRIDEAHARLMTTDTNWDRPE